MAVIHKCFFFNCFRNQLDITYGYKLTSYVCTDIWSGNVAPLENVLDISGNAIWCNVFASTHQTGYPLPTPPS